MEWEQDISMFDWFFTPNNTSSKVIAITIGTIKYCYNIYFNFTFHSTINETNWRKQINQTFLVELCELIEWNWVEWFVARFIKKVKFTFFNYAIMGYKFSLQQTQTQFITSINSLISLYFFYLWDWFNERK